MAVTSTRDVLAETVTVALRDSTRELVIWDSPGRQWRRLTWSQIYRMGESIAAEFADRGESGPIGLVGDPSAELVACVVGAWLAGKSIIIVPGPMRGLEGREWAAHTAERLRSVGVTVVVGAADATAELAAAAAGTVRVLDAAAAASTGRVAPQGVVEDSLPAVLQSTAGSTGVPKTAVVSRAAVVANTGAIQQRLGLDGRVEVVCSWLPLYHDMGLIVLMNGLTSGAETWLVPNKTFAAAPYRWLSWLSESRATLTAGPNFGYDILGRCAAKAGSVELSSLRIAISGGEPIDPVGFDRFLRETAPFGFDPAAAVPAYGLAESVCAVTMPASGTGARYDEVDVETEGGSGVVRRRYAVLGHPMPGTELRIVPSSAEVPAVVGRMVGEIEIRGASMMTGYLGEPARDPDEWFATGDLGYLTDDGLVVCGRAKELIIVAGRNIFPIEIERAAATVAGVRGGGVVAVGIEGGPRPGLVLAVEYRGSDTDDARKEIARAVRAVSGVTPVATHFVPPGALPRTTSGKLRRLQVRQYVEQQGVGQ
ncbi:long-chain-fatty acid--ACP ligase MbtM [Nocardia sp. NBC_00508]|uniref:long-chain-fatty acid--ACP ligase MbtM n=1 Tax=Nocardia sp. NBC_00508 TaxID=2975992 RepID=UPI002E8202FC|nr:long-chain-fatty acid--ACP ligase MbtM [Nocardia sp. NBC_00508]WUD69806.1 long-chain-fatty acid--ACP ligase MbtM [Nocardia sp. NBC_00508]